MNTKSGDYRCNKAQSTSKLEEFARKLLYILQEGK